jgi:hypothetical protein
MKALKPNGTKLSERCGLQKRGRLDGKIASVPQASPGSPAMAGSLRTK